MIICWDNIEKLEYNPKTEKFRKGKRGNEFLYKDSCQTCGKPYLTVKYHNSNFCSHKCSWKTKEMTWGDKISKSKKGVHCKDENPNWRGGYFTNNIPTYDTYAQQINWCELVRRSKEDKNILEVKCTYCGKWHVPKIPEVQCRIKALYGKTNGEYRFYCSDVCRKSCSIFRKKLYELDFEINSSREVQPELRHLTFKRDNYTCQNCNKNQDELNVGLHCHHIEGIRWEPLESADVDKCITVCKNCHIKIHKIPGCGYNDMKCYKL